MADVAERAGVSVMTVSRVLNGSPRVSDDTRDRVEEAIRALGYRANSAARRLAGGRSRILGAIGVGTDQYGPSQALLGIESAARESGHALSFVTLGEATAEGMQAALDQLTDAGVEGVIALAPIRSALDALAGLEPSVPVVASSDAPLALSTVGIDQYAGARVAAAHLLDLGHRTVHHISGPEGWVDGEARVQGWKDEHRARGLQPGRCLAGDWTPGSGYRTGTTLAADPEVTAVFAGNDSMAMGVLLALHDAGRRVPEDVSVVGFDDSPEAGFTIPPLTTVRQDFDELGRLSVHTLLATLAGEPTDPRPLTPGLVVRRTTASPTL
jgi:DNA-binding LacI/PurR family transcriptional regulator